MLDPRLLRSFVAIADTGSFTQAAERLNMTQSTISQQLARLEEAVGRGQIDRVARPVRATASGERLLGYARRLIRLSDETVAAFEDAAAAEPAIVTAQRLFGEPDYLFRVLARDLTHYQEIYDTRLGALPGVQRLTSTMVMRNFGGDGTVPIP